MLPQMEHLSTVLIAYAQVLALASSVQQAGSLLHSVSFDSRGYKEYTGNDFY